MSVLIGIVGEHVVTVEADANERDWVAACTCEWLSYTGRSAREVIPRGNHHLAMEREHVFGSLARCGHCGWPTSHAPAPNLALRQLLKETA